MTHTPFEIFGEDRPAKWVITIDHATNNVPPEIDGGDLGIGAENMERHIAYDIGARGVGLRLGEILDAPVVASTFSRLVIDPNRGEEDPTQIMQLYDGTIIPANRGIQEAEAERRRATYYRPYHAAVAKVLANRSDAILIAMHSFSPKLNGRAPRPWDIGILHAPQEGRFGIPLVKRLGKEADLCVGDNEPYAGYLPGDSVDRHSLLAGIPNALLEIRQDLIREEADQIAWAERLAPILTEVRAQTGL